MSRTGRVALVTVGVLTAAGAVGLAVLGVPVWLAALLGVNVVTVLTYGYDKHAARTRRWRVPEATLHLLAAAGGTPGALLAQGLFRHKTRDRTFRVVFFLILIAQAALVVAIVALNRR